MRYPVRLLYVRLHLDKFPSKIVFTSVLVTAIFISIYSLAHAFQVTLAWDPNGESDLAGYRTYYGTESGNYTYNVEVGKNESVTIAGLDLGKKYYFAVTAYDQDGNESDFSSEISFQVPNSNLTNAMPWIPLLLLDE